MSLPSRIGPYEILTQIAQGGMGAIYLARTGGMAGFERYLVLKTMTIIDDDHDTEAMFLDEARVLGGLHHHRIAAVHDVARADDYLFMVMEYVHGRDAFEVWQRTVELGAALPLDFALTVTSAAASGLQYAHTRRDRDGKPLNIVHRDVSLPNLMIGFDGAVKLIDFGIAKAANRSQKTQVGFIKGKLGCMAPEQLKTSAVDARTDVFALGIVLYELTTMRRAFRVESDQETIDRIRRGTYTPPSQLIPDFPPDLERLIERALRVDPRERFPDAESMRREIEALGHRYEFVLGDAAVIEVMAQLFDDRTEPWQQEPQQRRQSRAETDFDFAFDSPHEAPTRLETNPLRALQSASAILEEHDRQASGGVETRRLSTPLPMASAHIQAAAQPSPSAPPATKPPAGRSAPPGAPRAAAAAPPATRPPTESSDDLVIDEAFARVVVDDAQINAPSSTAEPAVTFATGTKAKAGGSVPPPFGDRGKPSSVPPPIRPAPPPIKPISAPPQPERAKPPSAPPPPPSAPPPLPVPAPAAAVEPPLAPPAPPASPVLKPKPTTTQPANPGTAGKTAAPAAKAEKPAKPEKAAKPPKPEKTPKLPKPPKPTKAFPMAPAQRRSIAPYIIGGVVLVAAAIAVLTMVLEGDGAKAKPDAAAPKPSAVDSPDSGVASVPVAIDAGVQEPAVDAAASEPASGKVTLKLTSKPDGAVVLLGTRRLGKTPFEGTVDAAPGMHLIKLRFPGYVSGKLEIKLEPGVITQHFDLVKE